MGKRAQTLSHGRSIDSLPRQKSKKFYQTSAWRNLRKEYKKQKRKEHERIVLQVYKNNPENKPQDLLQFLQSDMPLCEHNLKKGIIKVASVLDHKKRIRAGGAKLSKSNLWFVTEEYHNRKSGQEAHE